MAKHRLQARTAATEQVSGPLDATHGPRDLASYPDALTDAEFCELMALSRSRFYRLVKAGQLHTYALLPRYGARLWRKDRVAAYYRGELAPGARFQKRSA